MFEFQLPFRVRTKNVTGIRFALSLKCEHFAGVIEDRCGRILFCTRPLCVRQRAKLRGSFANADVA